MLISMATRPGKAAAKALWTCTIIVIIYTTTAAAESESNPGYFQWRTEGGGRPVPGVYPITSRRKYTKRQHTSRHSKCLQ